MAKVTWGSLPERDDPIFSGGLQIHFSPQSTKSTAATPKRTAGAQQFVTTPAPQSSDPNAPETEADGIRAEAPRRRLQRRDKEVRKCR